MTDVRQIVYRLKAVQDPSSAATIKAFGKSIQDALNTKTRAGGGDAFGRIADGLKKSAGAVSDLDRQMKKLNDTHNKRIAMEAAASKREMAEIDKKIAALKRLDAQEEAMAKREEQREHKRHRARQLSIATQNRNRREERANEAERQADERRRQEASNTKRGAAKEAADARASEIEGDRIHGRHRQRQRSIAMQNRVRRQDMVDEILAANPEKEDDKMSLKKFSKELKEAHHGVMQLAEGFAYMGLAGSENSEKMLQGLLKLQGAMHFLKGGMNLAKTGPAGMLALGGLAVGSMAAAQVVRRRRDYGGDIHDLTTGRKVKKRSYDPDSLAGDERVGMAMLKFRSFTNNNLYGRPDGDLSNLAGSDSKVKDAAYARYRFQMQQQQGGINREATQGILAASAEIRGLATGAQAGAYTEGLGEMNTGFTGMQNVDRLSARAAMTDNRLRPFAQLDVAAGRTAAAVESSKFAGSGSRQAMSALRGRQEELSTSYFEQSQIHSNANISTPSGLQDKEQAAKEMLRIEKEYKATLIEEQSIIKESAAERIAGQESVIQSLREEKAERLGVMQEEKDRIKAGTQAFGGMDRWEQQKVLRLKKTIDEADALEAGGDVAGAEAVRKSITKVDRKFAAGVPLRGFQDFVEKANEEDAKRNGLGDLLKGDKSQKIIDEQQAKVNAIDAKVEGSINMTLDLKSDADKNAKVIAERVKFESEAMIKEVVRQIMADRQRELSKAENQTKSKAAYEAEQAESAKSR